MFIKIYFQGQQRRVKRGKGGARSKIGAGAKGANVDGESISAGGFSEGEVVEGESTEKEQKTREPIQGRVFPKGTFAEVESLGEEEKSGEAIQADISAERATTLRNEKAELFDNDLQKREKTGNSGLPSSPRDGENKLPDQVSNQSLNGQEKSEAIEGSTLEKVLSKSPSEDAADKESSKTAKMSGKKEEGKGQKKKTPFVSDKFCCPLPDCGFVPRLASKQQMYAHYGMEHYRWVI